MGSGVDVGALCSMIGRLKTSVTVGELDCSDREFRWYGKESFE
jgi:hypothetical protein